MRILNRCGVVSGFAILTFALISCAKPPAPQSPAAPAPVGHVYSTIVPVPPPPSKRIKVTPKQQEELQQAFNVIGLKSALMVGALSCQMQDRYDAFMHAYQSHILADQHVMDAYFNRIGNRTKEDAYVTLLANDQSIKGLSEGQVFCLNNRAQFDAVMALKTPGELDSFVTDKAPGYSTAPTRP